VLNFDITVCEALTAQAKIRLNNVFDGIHLKDLRQKLSRAAATVNRECGLTASNNPGCCKLLG
jgi:hypothetical protein